MEDVRATISIGDESLNVVAGLLESFPKGSRVRVVLSQELQTDDQPQSVEGYLTRLDEACRLLPPCPWESVEEAIRELRDGEQD